MPSGYSTAMNKLEIIIMKNFLDLSNRLLILMLGIRQWLPKKKMPSEDMSGLEPVVFLAKGARVMLTMNLWSSVGLCNGATGTVVDFIFQNDHQPPALL